MRRLGIATLLAALVVAPAAARAEESHLLTDPEGDATGFAAMTDPLTHVPLDSDPGGDILFGDVEVSGGDLSVTWGLKDLDHSAAHPFEGRQHSARLNHGGGGITISVSDVGGQVELRTIYYASTTSTSSSAEVPGTVAFDEDASTVTVSIALDDLNAAIDAASDQTDNLVRSGSRLTLEYVQTYKGRTASTPELPLFGSFGPYYLSYVLVDIASDGGTYTVP